MANGKHDLLAARYAEILNDICVLIAHRQPPWWNRTAHKGLPRLVRSSQPLRGLAAVIGWHQGEQFPKKRLCWRLCAPSAAPALDAAAVFRLPSRGGDALYAAVPARCGQRFHDTVTREHAAYSPPPRLRAQLDGILRRVGPLGGYLSPDDLIAIVSLAQAFLRRNGDRQPPSQAQLDGAWTPARLARVAAWAQLVADDVRIEVFGESYNPEPLDREYHGDIRYGFYDYDVFTEDIYYRFEPEYAFQNWLRRPRDWPPVREIPDVWRKTLRQAEWLQYCLPAELRQRAEPIREDEPEVEHLVPEQPLRPGLVQARTAARAPGVTMLTIDFPYRQLPVDKSDVVPWAMWATTWRDKAALGLAIVGGFEPHAQVCEPGQAWRVIGRVARTAVAQGTDVGRSLDSAIASAGLSKHWRTLRKRHVFKTWFQPTSQARLHDLAASGRWHWADIDQLLHKHGLLRWWDGGLMYRASQMPLVPIATLCRSCWSIDTDDSETRPQIARVLGCNPSWAAVLKAAARQPWERHKRPKRRGGVRWLDVPSPKLRAAQRWIARLLFAVTPSQAATTAFHPGASHAIHACAHTGAVAAVRVDVANFFDSIRPWHLAPWLGLDKHGHHNLLPDWKQKGRRAVLKLLFRRRNGKRPYLPQGAPSSPAAANLAGVWLDRAVIHRAAEVFGPGGFTYTRYADDLVLSTRDCKSGAAFLDRGYALLADAVASQGWRIRPSKTHRWTAGNGDQLHLAGLRVPRDRSQPLSLERDTWRRARAALHQLRMRLDYRAEAPPGSPNRAHGLLAYAYSVTGDLRWIGYTSALLQSFARQLAGPLFSESFLAGWSDSESLVLSDEAMFEVHADLPTACESY